MNTPKLSPMTVIILTIITFFVATGCKFATDITADLVQWAVNSPFTFTGVLVLAVAFLLAIGSSK